MTNNLCNEKDRVGRAVLVLGFILCGIGSLWLLIFGEGARNLAFGIGGLVVVAFFGVRVFRVRHPLTDR